MQLHFLGTGAGCPTALRNVSSLALQMPEHDGHIWMFDCGEGTQHRVHTSPLRLTKLSHIFLTHLHGDHVFGVPGILSSRASQGATAPLTIYGPPGTTKLVRTVLQLSSTRLRYPLSIIEWKDGDCFLEAPFRITIAQLEHGIPSFGICLEEHPPKLGALNIEKLSALGIPKGPIYGRLKEETELTLPDGRILHQEDFLLPAPPARKVVICGDTRPCVAALHLAHQAHILVHEATYRHTEAARAARFHHTTSQEAAQLAAQAGVQTLILTHFSARYDLEETQSLLAEARMFLPDTEVAYDGWSYQIPRPRRQEMQVPAGSRGIRSPL